VRLTPEPDSNPVTTTRRAESRSPGRRNRLALMAFVLLVLSGGVGGTAVGALAPNLGQMVFMVAVALFVAAMLTLAFGMIGDARRRH
jgi:uncharacterized membrane protein